MARTAAETAKILTILYEEQFNQEYSEPFRITWQQLRFLADVPLLNDYYLKAVNKELADSNYNLVPCNHFLVIVMDHDLERFRMLPDRLLEKCLYEIDDIELGDDDMEEEEEETEDYSENMNVVD